MIASGRRAEDVAVRLVVAGLEPLVEPRLDQALLLVASEGGALDLLAGYASFQAARRPGAWSATAEPTPRNLCIDAVYTLSVYLSL